MHRKLVTLLTLFMYAFSADAQLPVCSGPGSGLIYFIGGTTLYNLDPTQPLSGTNPVANTIPLPPGAIGIAVSNNINGPGPSPTFYVVAGTTYFYYDGTAWVNTNHTSGAVNPGGGGNVLYSLEGSSGQVYKYDGTGNATLLTTIADFKGGGPYDCICDCHGNFYILRTSTSPDTQYLRKYNPSGVLIQSWSVTGAPSSSSGGGMAIIGSKVYFINGSGYWEGTISGSTLNFTQLAPTISQSPIDFSSCALGGIGSGGKADASAEALYFCDTSETRTITSLSDSAGDIVTWAVATGKVSLSSTSGKQISVSAKSNGSIILTVADTAECGNLKTDTIEVYIAKATVDAGTGDTILGCHEFMDTLSAKVTDTTAGMGYTISWQPADKIISGGNTTKPVVKFTGPTEFIITVAGPADKGGCTFRDTVLRNIDEQVIAVISVDDTLICTDDTASLNASRSEVSPYGSDVKYRWDFGDGETAFDNYVQHNYPKEATYTVRLVVTDSTGCADTTFAEMDIRQPPYINLGNDTAVCDGIRITLPTMPNTQVNVDTYAWWDGTDVLSKVVAGRGKYILTVKNICGHFTDTLELLTKDCYVWFPSAFSPNGDGQNDIARARGKHLTDISHFEMVIVNRYGEQVYKTSDVFEGWDGMHKGMAAQMGTYYYFIRYQLNGAEESVLLKGDLALVR